MQFLVKMCLKCGLNQWETLSVTVHGYVPPLCRTPDAVASIASLTQLCLNDVAIPRLPLEIGKWVNRCSRDQSVCGLRVACKPTPGPLHLSVNQSLATVAGNSKSFHLVWQSCINLWLSYQINTITAYSVWQLIRAHMYICIVHVYELKYAHTHTHTV